MPAAPSLAASAGPATTSPGVSARQLAVGSTGSRAVIARVASEPVRGPAAASAGRSCTVAPWHFSRAGNFPLHLFLVGGGPALCRPAGRGGAAGRDTGQRQMMDTRREHEFEPSYMTPRIPSAPNHKPFTSGGQARGAAQPVGGRCAVRHHGGHGRKCRGARGALGALPQSSRRRRCTQQKFYGSREAMEMFAVLFGPRCARAALPACHEAPGGAAAPVKAAGSP